MKEYLDITLPIRHGMLMYPTDRPCMVEKAMSTANGDIVNLTELSLSAHTGTHIDAPYHFFEDGKKIDELNEKQLVGKAMVFDFSDKQYYIDKNDLTNKDIQKGDIILLKTKNSKRLFEDTFFEDYVYVNEEAAAYLAEKEIAALGFDYLSPDAYGNPDYPCHQLLLGIGAVIIEGLNLSDIVEGEYEIVALPLKIAGGDGAPARVLLKRISV